MTQTEIPYHKNALAKEEKDGSPIKVLNLFAGVGGNRKLWENVDVTAVEDHPKIASVYRKLFPEDEVIEGDAHEYLLHHYHEFDYIWSSPPCQTHSRMAKATRHKLKRYPDMRLYQEILFLQNYASMPWVVENVAPYYTPLISGQRLGRHMFWSNYSFPPIDIPRPSGFINLCNLKGKRALMDWLGIHFEENIYYGNNHCPAQILRNCVHPEVGLHIFQHRPQ